MNDDMYSLYEWLKDEELEAMRCIEISRDIDFWKGYLLSVRCVMNKVVNTDNQRPHIRGKV